MVDLKQLEVVDVVVVGAGWMGLSAARTYLMMRPDANVLILDGDNSVGGVWSKDRVYPNLVAQIKLGFFNYTDSKMEADPDDPDSQMVTGDMIHKYLQKYAEDNDLIRRTRFNTWVDSARKCERGWRLTLKNSGKVIETSKFIVATGITSIPSFPNYDMSSVSVPILHSKNLGTSMELLGKDNVQHVAVIGAAKSAYDAVYYLLSLGKRVTWVIRNNGSGPIPVLPTRPFGLAHCIEVSSTKLMTHLSPCIFNTSGPMYRLMQKTRLGRWIMGKVWDALTMSAHQNAGYDDGDDVSKLVPEIDRQSVFWANSGLGIVTLPDFWQTFHSGNPRVVRDSIDSLKEDTLLLKENGTLQIDALVCCTGWGDHYGIFDDETKAELGLPIYSDRTTVNRPTNPIDWATYDYEADRVVNEKLPFLTKPPNLLNPHTNDESKQMRFRLYRRIVPIIPALRGDRSIAILGQIHTTQTPMVADMQAFWACLYLLGEIEMPGLDEMATETAEWDAWTRKRYLSSGQKYPYAIFDFLPYAATLLKDLGVSSNRKSNWFQEWLMPYKPEHFNGFREEYFANKQKQEEKKRLLDSSTEATKLA